MTFFNFKRHFLILKSESDAERFLTLLNEKYPNIKFTIEKKTKKKPINFHF